MDEPGYRARRRAEKEDLLARQGHSGGPRFETSEPFNEPYTPGPSSDQDGKHGTPFLRPGEGNVKDLGTMRPHLQFIAGPMLRYDTVDMGKNEWRGFAMIVTVDAGSVYEPAPVLTFRWHPGGENGLTTEALDVLAKDIEDKVVLDGTAAPTGDHPPSTDVPSSTTSANVAVHAGAHLAFETRQAHGQPIYTYHEPSGSGSYTFWRFPILVPLADRELPVRYSINGGSEIVFWVPARGMNLRWAAYSCNGFSAGVKEEDFNGPDPLWNDLLRRHAQQPIHALVGGGDQLYCDKVTREPELQDWTSEHDSHKRMEMPLTEEIKTAIDRFYFNHYCNWFGRGAFGKAIAQIPCQNILDDHDLIDGFGSYPDELMTSPIFNHIGSRGIFWYLLFQLFIVDDIDGVAHDKPHTFQSIIIGGPGVYTPWCNHSWLTYMGPKVWLLAIDCRAERRKDQCASSTTYERVFERVRRLPDGVEHLVVLLGVPLAYPRMVFLEDVLESKFNPVTMLARTGSLGLGGFVNKFNGDAELLDDLSDHWCAKHHKKERNWLVEETQKLATERRLRISFLSGDVHCAGTGVFWDSKLHDKPAQDPKYMLAVITSAIVNTPPPTAVIHLVNKLATKKHKTLHYIDTEESMLPMFEEDTDGSKLKEKYILGRRNYCIVSRDDGDGGLEFDVRVEIKQGGGETKGYPVRTPAPQW